MFAPLVERWAPMAIAVAAELAQDEGAAVPYPSNTILATVQNESGGIPGRVGDGGRSLGLMQCQAPVMRTHNEQHPTKAITWSQLGSSTNADAARAQLRLGAWYLMRHARALHRENPIRFPWPEGFPSDDQIAFSDIAFAAGWGAMRQHRAAARASGLPDTLAGLTATEGPVPLRKLRHAARAVRWTHNPAPPERTTRGPRPGGPPSGLGGGLVVGGLLLLAWWWFGR